ncbi:hypothetical protein Sste5346_000046 [Sporothrix stenoceras]|uniref:carboxypeptidase C n=1 Tax=Sporothrix stenoceras TaxID=5173 RepID=A0ABR3ZTV6_9PEZI
MKARTLFSLSSLTVVAALAVLEPVGLKRGNGYAIEAKATGDDVCAGSEGLAGFVHLDRRDRHIFFWAFESRNDPATDPVVLWMTGGPGGSSTGIGGLVELGPCLVRDANSTISNPNAWNNNATVLFVDQPANVGYSYSSVNVTGVDEATDDMHLFLRVFFATYPQLQDRPFYIAGESFGGTWVPRLAERILDRETSGLSQVVASTTSTSSVFAPIQLRGVLLGNTQVEQADQWKGFYDTGCTGAQPLFNATACTHIQLQAARCESLLPVCDRMHYDQALCAAVLQYCREESVFFIVEAGLNPYDFRRTCDPERFPNCYQSLVDAEIYMSSERVRRGLGLSIHSDDRPFVLENYELSVAFTQNGDVGTSTSDAVRYLLDKDIPVLIYVGNKDWFCNAAGTRYWVNNMPWHGLAPFRAAPEQPWYYDGQQAGWSKSYKNLKFVEVFDAGHMVPMDKGAEAVAMVNDFLFSQ